MLVDWDTSPHLHQNIFLRLHWNSHSFITQLTVDDNVDDNDYDYDEDDNDEDDKHDDDNDNDEDYDNDEDDDNDDNDGKRKNPWLEATRLLQIFLPHAAAAAIKSRPQLESNQ